MMEATLLMGGFFVVDIVFGSDVYVEEVVVGDDVIGVVVWIEWLWL